MDKGGYVYILASTFKHLYTGVTSDLMTRVHQHKTSRYPDAFTTRYKITHLVWYRPYETITEAIAAEKHIKSQLRIKKIQLIVQDNPTWQDLSLEWGKPTKPFKESDLKPPTSF